MFWTISIRRQRSLPCPLFEVFSLKVLGGSQNDNKRVFTRIWPQSKKYRLLGVRKRCFVNRSFCYKFPGNNWALALCTLICLQDSTNTGWSACQGLGKSGGVCETSFPFSASSNWWVQLTPFCYFVLCLDSACLTRMKAPQLVCFPKSETLHSRRPRDCSILWGHSAMFLLSVH